MFVYNLGLNKKDKYLYPFCILFCLLIFCVNISGCNLNVKPLQIASNPVKSSDRTKSASIRFNFLTANDLKANAISLPNAEFQLLILNYDNPVLPFTMLKKIAEISNNQAHTTFTSLPSGFVIAKVLLHGASIASNSVFVGIGDLFEGKETVVNVAASGSLKLPDILANTAFYIASDTELTKKLPVNLAEQLVSLYSTLAQAEASNSQLIYQKFKTRVNTSVITQITAGETHALALRSDRNIFTWGDNSAGQLADSEVSSIIKPTINQYVYDVDFIVAGNDCSMAITASKTIVAWGNNSSGQIPNTSNIYIFPPISVSKINNVSKLSIGAGHVLALTNSGNILSWGSNSNGELGINTFSAKESVSNVTLLDSVVKVSAGDAYSMALKSDGTVWAWGNNDYAQLATSVASSSVPLKISGLTAITDISAGSTFCMALKSDGTVWAWGSNIYGESGIATSDPIITHPTQITNLTNVSAVVAGREFAVALKSDGSVWAWGNNSAGQLGQSLISSSNVPVKIAGLSEIVKVATGRDFALAIDSSNRIWSWGNGEAYQLGTSNTTSSHIPITISFSR